jgi:hypothetical protein
LFRVKMTYAPWIILALTGAAMLLATVNAGDHGGGGVHGLIRAVIT